MLTNRQIFFNHVAQTSDSPLALEIVKAEGVHLFDADGKKYIDLISGISVSNVGHRHPKVVTAIKDQLDKYMHLMVYGEFIQTSQTRLAKALAAILPDNLTSVYFVNSGTEAIEGAMKLAKRATGRTEIISFKHAYHGSSQGSLSIMGSEEFKNAFRPLLPDTRSIRFNSEEDLKYITEKTACVIVEPIQGEAGAVIPQNNFLKKLREQCDRVGALLVADEIQCGFGRTGSMFAFEQYDFTPDILCLAKGLGGGMPIGVFISSQKIMNVLTNNPVLGHITTFGGHPVSCAASLATLNVLLDEKLVDSVHEKELLFRSLLIHPLIRSINGKGLLLAVEFENYEQNKMIIDKCIKNGCLTDWFLFNSHSMRIAPPLTISHEEIRTSCDIILSSLSEIN
ncbi:MAG: ornithine/acetylornithine aminotransferase [Bacteroidetes bacterium]|jgi:acetylornithine/succinyldiaminopimelate/putrescine aminotransferase|nr:ornithine/acetylornithine aminotransferase [Bacteroidota bacterium]